MAPTPNAMDTNELEALRTQVQALQAEKASLEAQYNATFVDALSKRVEEERKHILAETVQFTAATSTARARKTKIDVAKPDTFSDVEGKLEDFLHQLHLIFWANPEEFNDEDQKITYTLSYMKDDRAQTWAQQFMKKHGHESTYTESWSDFVKLLKQSFGAVDPSLKAIDELLKLKQGKMSGDEYIVAFEEHEVNSGWNDKALMDQFEWGLNAELAASVYRLERMPKTLQEWKKWARQFDRQWRLYEEKRELQKQQKSSNGADEAQDIPVETTTVAYGTSHEGLPGTMERV